MDFLRQLADDTAAIAALVRACDLDAAVPSCPGWTVADVVRHLGQIHRWATTVVGTGESATREDPPVTDTADQLADWFADGAARLHDVLRATDPDTECWTFGFPPARAGFWRRRQAVETALHRWDIETALNRASTIPTDLAEAGIDEVIDFLYPRQVALGRTPPLDTPLARSASTPATEYFLALWARGDRERCGLPADARLTP